MSENHQDIANHSLATTEDVEWVLSKKSKLLIPQHKNQKRTTKVPFDWLNLIGVLLIPFVVTVIGLYATQQITQQQLQASERQHQTDTQIAQEQQQQTLLQDYMSYITSLILGVNTGKDSPTLIKAKLGDEISQVAQAQTLITVARLNSERKGILLRFLYDTKLINKGHVLIDLSGADFSTADLSGANLSGANLSGVDFSNANLEGTNLSEADLNGVTFDRANLRYANLLKASLTTLFVFYPDEESIKYTSIQNADLSVANLADANLQNANLSGTNLIETSLVDANLGGVMLKGAKYNTKAIFGKDVYGQSVTDPQGNLIFEEPTSWSAGIYPQAAGAICVDC